MEDLLLKYKQYEDKAKMVGWNFASLKGKIDEEELPWDYLEIVKEHLKPDMQLLDMETGGGEVLQKVKHPYRLTTVTEGYEPNYEFCVKKLKPKGITVVKALGEEKLPFDDHSFDIVINRHGAYNIDEVKRVLKPNGIFITQQVGSYNNKPMSLLLTPWRVFDYESFTLHTELDNFKDKFEIITQREIDVKMKYLNIEAVIFMAKIIEWEFPDFSVEKCFNQLKDIEDMIEKEGYFESIEHRFLIVARNLG